MEQLDFESWTKKVTGESGEYYQPSSLHSAGLVPYGFIEDHKGIKYPLQYVNQIIRVKTPDGREWLKSQTWIAIDRMGNKVETTLTDPDIYEHPEFQYELKNKDPKDPLSKMERKIVGVAKNIMKYELPFTAMNLEGIYKMRPSEDAASVSLSIVKVGYDGNKVGYPYQIEKYEDFATRPFDELYEFMSTPRYKLARSANDQLEAQHIR